MDGIQALALSKKYTSDTAESLGSLKGAPCTITKTETVDDGVNVTFSWTGTSGTTQTTTILVPKGNTGATGPKGETGDKGDKGDTGDTGAQGEQGIQGKSIASAAFNSDGKLVITLDDGTELAPITMPSAKVDVSSAEGNIIVQKADGMYVPETDISGKVDKVEGKELSANDFTDTLKTKLEGIEEGANKTVVDESLSVTSTNPVQNKVIKNLMGVASGFATLDSNGKMPSSQLPTSARQIKGQFDASTTHTLPDISGYNAGDELLVVGAGYYTQSTAFTLTAGNTLTEMEASQANTLIAAGYVFTLTSGETTLGTVSTFATDKVTFTDETSIDLPYSTDLSATSTPSVVQVTVAVGDEIINIDSHWIKLSNTSNVTSVNEKTGAVVLSADDVGAVGTDDIQTSFAETTSDTKVPSEKLVKDSLDAKANVSDLTQESITIYVDQVNGSDDNDGLTETTPIKEITSIADKVKVYNTKSLFICIMSDISYDSATSVTLYYVENLKIYAYDCASAYTKDFSKNKKITNVAFNVSFNSVYTIYNIDFESSFSNTLVTSAITAVNINKCRFTFTGTKTTETFMQFLRCPSVFIQNSEFNNYYAAFSSLTSNVNLKDTSFTDCDRFSVGRGSVITNIPSVNIDMITNGIFSEDSVCYLSDGTQYVNGVKSITSDDLPQDTLYIYVDQENGSDDNDGLTSDTPIKELTTITTKYNFAKYFRLYVCIMSDISYDTFTNISISGVNSINVCPSDCTSAYTTDYSKNKKLTNVRFGLSMCRANVNNLDFEGDTYSNGSNPFSCYDTIFTRLNMCRFTYTGTSYSTARGPFFQSSRGCAENCIFTGFRYALYLQSADVEVKNNTYDETSTLYMSNASVLRNLNTTYQYMLTNGNCSNNSIVYLSDGTQYSNKVRSLGKNDITDIDASLKMLGYTLPESLRGMNYIDSDGVFHQNIVRVDVGSVASSSWTYGSSNKWIYYKPGDVKVVSSNDTVANIYCVGYSAVSANTLTNDTTLDMKIGTNTAGSILFRNLSYTDVDSFLSAMSGVYVYYELATEITKKVDGNELGTKIGNLSFSVSGSTLTITDGTNSWTLNA